MTKPKWVMTFAVVALVGSTLARSRATDAVSGVRLYALDTGLSEASDMALFSDSGEYDGKTGKLVTPSFLIRHPKGDLLWDTGLSDELAKLPQGVTDGPFKLTVAKTLSAHLSELGLAPKDIEYLAFSHLHAEHTGNAGLFTSSTWIVSKKELGWALGKPTPPLVDPRTLAASKRVKLQQSDQDIDVFGDGTVQILRTPGHTPDHRSLLVKLARGGVLLLSGDVYHTKENVTYGRVPRNNVDRADSLASFDRVGKLLKQFKARLIVQHAPEDFASLPKFPAYLD